MKHKPYPFYLSQGNQCAQTAIKMVLGYFFPNTHISLSTLDKLTRRKDQEYTHLSQVSKALSSLGINHKYFVKQNLEEITPSKKPIFSDLFYGSQQAFKDNFDLNTIRRALTFLEKENISFTQPLLEEIIKADSDNELIICLNDLSKVGSFNDNISRPHYTLITSINQENTKFHDTNQTNPMSNRQCKTRDFISSIVQTRMDYGVLTIKNLQNQPKRVRGFDGLDLAGLVQ